MYAALGRAADAASAFEAAAKEAHRVGYHLYELFALRDLKLGVLDKLGHTEHGSRRLGAVLRLLAGPMSMLTPMLKGLDANELVGLWSQVSALSRMLVGLVLVSALASVLSSASLCVSFSRAVLFRSAWPHPPPTTTWRTTRRRTRPRRHCGRSFRPLASASSAAERGTQRCDGTFSISMFPLGFVCLFGRGATESRSCGRRESGVDDDALEHAVCSKSSTPRHCATRGLALLLEREKVMGRQVHFQSSD